MKIEVGSKVRIRKSALDSRSLRRGHHLPVYEVVAVVNNGDEEWVRVADPGGKGTSSRWPSRMLEQA